MFVGIDFIFCTIVFFICAFIVLRQTMKLRAAKSDNDVSKLREYIRFSVCIITLLLSTLMVFIFTLFTFSEKVLNEIQKFFSLNFAFDFTIFFFILATLFLFKIKPVVKKSNPVTMSTKMNSLQSKN